jgi:hypothetical protein
MTIWKIFLYAVKENIFQIVKKLWGLVFCFISLNDYKKKERKY